MPFAEPSSAVAPSYHLFIRHQKSLPPLQVRQKQPWKISAFRQSPQSKESSVIAPSPTLPPPHSDSYPLPPPSITAAVFWKKAQGA
ncbi:hypothetical protein HPP92_004457 [Vanilla planifolia]|uniref:Uncharacterized protein n=1 Tax=Vanilla planifolia TaxID=51239 RepID=A0A835VKC6_VANPL|nr:hypothetical protein HPP92_004457 [Vanilla planifolia]